MTHVPVTAVVDQGLGNSAYLVDLGDGRALVVDASRDLRAVRSAARERDLRVVFAADTHLHADFVTGALELAASDGAAVLASAAGGRQYPHRPLEDGDRVDLGGLELRAMTTTGHTHEHLAYELLDGSRTLGVFTGGSLLVGSAARTDLVSADRTEELARAQYRSLRRLAELDDGVEVWPTHGAGSFCSAPPGAERTSTIGRERESNALLRAESEDAFVSMLLGSLGSYPPYFDRLSEVNRRGPRLLGGSTTPAGLDPHEVLRLQHAGGQVVDVRPVVEFSAGHVPGSISIPLRDGFATWLGWLVDPGRPVAVVSGAGQDLDEVVWQSRKIGVDELVGRLAGGIRSWASAGLPVATTSLVTAAEMAEHAPGAVVLDIRQRSEYLAGHVPGALHVELGELTSRSGDLPVGPAVVMCGHGERAMSAASLLARSGRAGVAVLTGGPDDWAETTGLPLEHGS